jgi:hypothetical protein
LEAGAKGVRRKGRRMAFSAKFLCRYLGHRRARSAIQFNSIEQHYESVCKRCGVKLVRTADRQWWVPGELVD